MPHSLQQGVQKGATVSIAKKKIAFSNDIFISGADPSMQPVSEEKVQKDHKEDSLRGEARRVSEMLSDKERGRKSCAIFKEIFTQPLLFPF